MDHIGARSIVILAVLCCNSIHGLPLRWQAGLRSSGEQALSSNEGSQRGTVSAWSKVNADRSLTRDTEAMPKDRYVVLSINSGRRDRESLLLRYVEHLVDAGEIDEVHVIVNERRTNQTDIDWLHSLRGGAEKTRVIDKRYDGGIYNFYVDQWRPPRRYKDRTVIIKADDDVVYMDTAHFSAFTKYVVEHPRMFMVFANTVNNGVAAHYQQKAGRIPFSFNGWNTTMEYPPNGLGGSLWGDPRKAFQLHKLFLKNVSSFSWIAPENDGCIVYRPPNSTAGEAQGRFSINFFGMLHQRAEEAARLVRSAPPEEPDEAALTTMNTRNTLCMHTQFVVSHLSFNSQRMIDAKTLEWYKYLADITLPARRSHHS